MNRNIPAGKLRVILQNLLKKNNGGQFLNETGAVTVTSDGIYLSARTKNGNVVLNLGRS